MVAHRTTKIATTTLSHDLPSTSELGRSEPGQLRVVLGVPRLDLLVLIELLHEGSHMGELRDHLLADAVERAHANPVAQHCGGESQSARRRVNAGKQSGDTPPVWVGRGIVSMRRMAREHMGAPYK